MTENLAESGDQNPTKKRIRSNKRQRDCQYVVRCTKDEFNEIAGSIENRVFHQADVSRLAARKNDSAIQLVFRFFANGLLRGVDVPFSIQWMNALDAFFPWRQVPFDIEATDATPLLGGVGDFPSGDVPCATARVAQPLGFRQIRLGLTQLLFSARALDDLSLQIFVDSSQFPGSLGDPRFERISRSGGLRHQHREDHKDKVVHKP